MSWMLILRLWTRVLRLVDTHDVAGQGDRDKKQDEFHRGASG